ncbi:hypothetical protein JCM10450v2_006610 [Rhodotorula kratochvilovae]
MADVAAEQALLLRSLAALYGWLIPAAIRTLRKASRDYHGAIATFQKQWASLMPHERTDAVDLLLSAYCGSIATELADTIADRIHAIAEFCRARFPDAPSSQYTTEWEELIAGPAGLDVNKVRRMDDTMAEAVLRVLDRLLLGLRTGRAGLRKLESADTVLIIAHFDSQPADTRFERLHQFLRDIGNLWSGHLLASAPEVVALRTAEASLATPHSRQLFTALSPPQQFYAIYNARKIVFAACEGRAQSDELPSLNEALHDFFQPLLHPQVSAAFPVSKPPPATFASLSHGRISDRKARRYYGTTARAWAAGRGEEEW